MAVAHNEMEGRIVVCARSYAAALDYAYRKGYERRQVVYVERGDQLRGMRNVTVHLVGSWHHLADVDEIIRVIHTQDHQTEVVE